MQPKTLTHSMLAEQLPERCDTLWVALSGGLDSTVLVHLAAHLRDLGGVAQVNAVHVHHGLQADADRWVCQVERLCAQLSVPLVVERIELEGPGNLEAQARDARYRVFAQQLGTGECLLLAHHQQDQAETLLYRLCRGAGLKGLSGMPRQRPLGQGRLLRPLLDCTKTVLQQYALDHQLTWVEDPSNTDARFDRNFLRHQVLPQLASRWPKVNAQLAKTAAHCAEEQALLSDYARQELALWPKPSNPFLSALPVLNSVCLAVLPGAKQKLLLRTWLADAGYPLPQAQQLERLRLDLLTPRADADPCFVFDGGAIRRYREGLYLVPDRSEPEPFCINFCGEAGFSVNTECLFAAGLQLQTATEGVRLRALGECVVRYRTQNEFSLRFALAGRQGRKSLKKWLQEAGVPPWLRSQIPLLFSGTELVAVAGIGVLEGYQAEAGECGFTLQWKPV